MPSRRHGLLILCLAALAARIPPARAQPAPRPTRILLLYSHDPRAPGAVAFAHELTRTLRREWPAHVEVYEEALDVDRVDSRATWPPFAAYLSAKYHELNPDAIVAEGSVAVQFAAERLTTAFPGTPIVYGIAFEPVVDFKTLPASVTGRRLPMPYAGTFKLARALQPHARRVVLVSGASALDSVLAESAMRDIRPFLNGMQLELLRNWSYPSLLRTLHDLPWGTFVILASFRRDSAGQSFNLGDLIPSITRASSVPVYGPARNWVGDGIVGGETMEFAAEGGRTARLLMRVLRQPRGTPLPPQELAVNPTVVDWRQLERWDLPERLLPRGTVVLFRPPTLWERHRVVILVILGITVAQSALIGLLLLERRRRIRTQQIVALQAEHEQLLAAVKVDVAEYVADESVHALEQAVSRIGRYGGATSATLFVPPEQAGQPPLNVHWTREERVPSPVSDAAADASAFVSLPLMSERTLVGELTLGGVVSGDAASSGELQRLQGAAELIAQGLARVRAWRAVAEARGHVAHLARIATIGELTAVVSHELRQPLTAIRINADAGSLVLQRETPDFRELQTLIRDILNEVERATELVEQLRTMFRKQQETDTIVSLNDVCRNAVRLLQRVAEERGVAVDFAFSEPLPGIRADAAKLQQVVLNLALNAIESAAMSDRERRVVIRTADRASSKVELEVIDTGVGLPPEVQAHLFESYFSTKKTGLGLGLRIVHQIVEEHNGRVRAENRPGSGAMFRVTLPTAMSAARPTDDRPDAARVATSGVRARPTDDRAASVQH